MKYGAGILFACFEDRTIYLAKRSEQVSDSGTWSVLGGTIEENESPWQAAVRELIEEAGSLPRIKQVLTRTTHRYRNIKYTTFVCEISKKEKNRWKPKLNFEHMQGRWFSKLPRPLHPGLIMALRLLYSSA